MNLSEREKLLLEILDDIVSMLPICNLDTDVETKDEIKRKIDKLTDMHHYENGGWK